MGRKKKEGGKTPGVQFRLPGETLAIFDAKAEELSAADGTRPNRSAAVRFSAQLLKHAKTVLPIRGTIAAGADTEPEVYDDPELITFWEEFPRGSYALKVTGNSCSKWGICDGDTVVVAPQTEATEGRFHALRSSGGAHTLKGFSRGKWWQFGTTDGEPTEYKLTPSTNVFAVVVGGRFGRREFHAPVQTKQGSPMTHDQAALLRAIIDDPADNVVRLVYADWLEENGQGKHARFVRMQVRRATGEPGQTLAGRLSVRKWFNPWWPGRSCWRFYTPQWDLIVGRVRYASEFGPGEAFYVRRGFMDEVRCMMADWMEHGRAIAQANPLEVVTITDKAPYHNGAGWCWLNENRPWPSQRVGLTANLERGVFEALKGGGNRWEPYPTVEAANAALSAALIAWARAPVPQPA